MLIFGTNHIIASKLTTRTYHMSHRLKPTLLSFSLLSVLGLTNTAFALNTVLINKMGDNNDTQAPNMLCYQSSVSNNPDTYNLVPGTGDVWLTSDNEQAQYAIDLNSPDDACPGDPNKGYNEGSIKVVTDASGVGSAEIVGTLASGVAVNTYSGDAAHTQCNSPYADTCIVVTSDGTAPVIPPVTPVDPTQGYPNAQSYKSGVLLRGVNLSGAEFADDGTGHAAEGMFIPTLSDAPLFLYTGANTYRVPITWEYIANKDGSLKTEDAAGTTYLQNLDALIKGLIDKKATVILDLHNYMRYNPTDVSLNYKHKDPNGSDVIGNAEAGAPSTQDYATLWANLATRYSAPNMMYDIMNEPHDMPMQQVVANENAAIAAIRTAETALPQPINHYIFVEGNYWSGLHSWNGDDSIPNDTLNSREFPSQIVDPLPTPKFAIEVHQYFDTDSSGTYPTGDCIPLRSFQKGYSYKDSSGNYVHMAGFDEYWRDFKKWSRENNIPVYLGEFGSPDTLNCRSDINYMLQYATKDFAYTANSKIQSGLMGWTVWAAGGSWGNYINSIAPGGPANTLMWDNALYQNYLTSTATLPGTDKSNTPPPLLKITNNSSQTLLFSSGNWPFWIKGDATLKPGDSAYLYNPDTSSKDTSPAGDFKLTYHVGSDTGDVIGFGVNNGEGYQYDSVSTLTDSEPKTSCEIKGDDRCWVVTDAK